MYYLLLAIFYPLSWLPFWVLYGLSDVLFVVLYHLVRYRVTVVRDNLQHAFPEQSAAEILKIERKFYRHFCDQWVETVKLLSISKKGLLKRMTVDTAAFLKLNDAGISCYTLMPHSFNFEWANVATGWLIPQRFAGVYMIMNNKAFEKLMLKIRGRSGNTLIPANNFRQVMQLRDETTVVGLISDQNPANRNKVLWESFFGRPVPWYRIPADAAIKLNNAVAFAYIQRVKRGYYHASIDLYTEGAQGHTANAIMKAFIHHIEKRIRQQPENYMWTHKRWKYQAPE